MPSAITDAQPLRRLSRYRSIRGRNVPESRRYVEPLPAKSADHIAAFTNRSTNDNVEKPPPRFSSNNPYAQRVQNESQSQNQSQSQQSQPQKQIQSTATTVPTPTPVAPSSLPQSNTPPTTIPLQVNNSSSGQGGDNSARHLLLEEQKRKDLERLQRELANHQPHPPPPSKSPMRDRFSFFSRRRGHSATSASSVPPTPPLPPSSRSFPAADPPATRHGDRTTARMSERPSPRPMEGPQGMDRGERPERLDRAERGERMERGERLERLDRAERGEKVQRPERLIDRIADNSGRAEEPPAERQAPKTVSRRPAPKPTPPSRADSGPPPATAIGNGAPLTKVGSTAPDGSKREIVVRCGQHAAKIPITHETAVAEILQYCTGVFASEYDPANSVLLECYTRIGLERRLRRYERIRDIMNTWDGDGTNYLVIKSPADAEAAAADASASHSTGRFHTRRTNRTVSAATEMGRFGHGADLELSSVPRSKMTPPGGFAFSQMYHSQKPGRWTKRFVSLIGESGRLVASKRADESLLSSLTIAESKIDDGSGSSSSKFFQKHSDFQSLCHLSDYDIYMPTESQVRKQLKPPKRFCFAIKSQQRTTIFVNTENFVHFFCTDHVDLARAFYDRIVAWRSWYLANKKLALHSHNSQSATTGSAGAAGAQKKGPPQPLIQLPQQQPEPTMQSMRQAVVQRSASRRVPSQPRRMSVDSYPSSDEDDSSSGSNRNRNNSRNVSNKYNSNSSSRNNSNNISNSRNNNKTNTATNTTTINKDDDDDDNLFAGLDDPLERVRRLEKQKSNNSVTQPLITTNDNETFDSQGLLGELYEERKRAELARVQRQNQSNTVVSRDGPFVAGPSLLNGGMGAAGGSGGSGGISRSRSQRVPSSNNNNNNNNNNSNADQSWFPSAAEHSARQRNWPGARESLHLGDRESTSRPTSSSGPTDLLLPSGGGGGGGYNRNVSMERSRSVHRRDVSMDRSRSTRRPNNAPPVAMNGGGVGGGGGLVMPQPLIDLTPKFQEAPQWSREGRGHGVRVTPGTTHLVDMATTRDTTSGHHRFHSQQQTGDQLSSRNIFRRDDQPMGLLGNLNSNQPSRRPTTSRVPSGPDRPTTGRSATMTSTSASTAAMFARSNSQRYRSGSRTRAGDDMDQMPPSAFLSRFPPSSSTQHGRSNSLMRA